MKSNESTPKQIDELVDQVSRGELARRDFLRRVVTLGVSSAVAYSLLNQAKANAQNATTFAVGEEASPPSATTRAIGEETPPTFTSQAIGEEGQPTTRALGEENPSPPMTTQSYGEEGRPTSLSFGEENTGPPATTQAIGEEGTRPPTYTTYAVGEEQPPNCVRPTPTTQAYGEETTTPPPPTYTTYAIGEETTAPPATTQRGGEENPGRITTMRDGEESGRVELPTPPSPTPGRPNTNVRDRMESTIRNQIPKVWKNFGRW